MLLSDLCLLLLSCVCVSVGVGVGVGYLSIYVVFGVFSALAII